MDSDNVKLTDRAQACLDALVSLAEGGVSDATKHPLFKAAIEYAREAVDEATALRGSLTAAHQHAHDAQASIEGFVGWRSAMDQKRLDAASNSAGCAVRLTAFPVPVAGRGVPRLKCPCCGAGVPIDGSDPAAGLVITGSRNAHEIVRDSSAGMLPTPDDTRAENDDE